PLLRPSPPPPPLFPYTTLFRSPIPTARDVLTRRKRQIVQPTEYLAPAPTFQRHETPPAHELPASNKSPIEPYAIDTESKAKVGRDRKSTRLNSSHVSISYAVFC